MSTDISIIIPTRGRPHRIRGVIDSLLIDPSLEIIILTESDDDSMRGFQFDPRINWVESAERQTPIHKWNIGAAMAKSEWLFLAADDLEFPPFWKQKALSTPNKGFIGFSDGRSPALPHFMMTREWAKKYNGGVLTIPHYKSWYTDIETYMRGGNTIINGGVILHHHAIWEPKYDDDTYAYGRAHHKEDELLFIERKAKNFPNDFESVIS